MTSLAVDVTVLQKSISYFLFLFASPIFPTVYFNNFLTIIILFTNLWIPVLYSPVTCLLVYHRKKLYSEIIYVSKIYALFKGLSLEVGRHIGSQGHLLPILMRYACSQHHNRRELIFRNYPLTSACVSRYMYTPPHTRIYSCTYTDTLNKASNETEPFLNEHISSYDKFSHTFHLKICLTPFCLWSNT